MKDTKLLPSFLEAIEFASYRHRFDKSKNEEPYINHVISVCRLLSVVAEVNDQEVLMAAALHDVLERTNTKPNELNFHFGEEVYNLVLEITDHQSDSDAEKFQMQLQRVEALSAKAKLIKLADKIANVKAILSYTPEGWDIEKRSIYINWADRFISAVRGTNEKLEKFYDEISAEGRRNNLYIPQQAEL
ncbi:MAG: HD domain-containing protein [Bacteroidota bacterium]